MIDVLCRLRRFDEGLCQFVMLTALKKVVQPGCRDYT